MTGEASFRKAILVQKVDFKSDLDINVFPPLSSLGHMRVNLFQKGKQFALSVYLLCFCILIIQVDMHPFVHSLCQSEAWTKPLPSPFPLSCVCLCPRPFALHFKWLFQGVVICGGEKSCTSVKTVTNWTAGRC